MDIRQLSSFIHLRSSHLSEVVRACRVLLRHSDNAQKARDYIGNRLSNYIIDEWNIGYFPDDDNLDLIYDIVDKDILDSLKLTYTKYVQKRGYAEAVNRSLFNNHNLIVPFNDEYGNIIALAGRTLLSNREQSEKRISKYKNNFFSKSLHLFGLNKAKNAIEKSNCAIVVEGQMDCISCHANGYFNTVGLTGSNLSRYQVYLLKKMADKIYLLFDNDTAGEEAFNKAYNQFSKNINIERLRVPENFNDIDQYLRESGKCSVFDVC